MENSAVKDDSNNNVSIDTEVKNINWDAEHIKDKRDLDVVLVPYFVLNAFKINGIKLEELDKVIGYKNVLEKMRDLKSKLSYEDYNDFININTYFLSNTLKTTSNALNVSSDFDCDTIAKSVKGHLEYYSPHNRIKDVVKLLQPYIIDERHADTSDINMSNNNIIDYCQTSNTLFVKLFPGFTNLLTINKDFHRDFLKEILDTLIRHYGEKRVQETYLFSTLLRTLTKI